MIRILQGDCREVMATLDAASIDAIVCDPPYELGFMGKGWDSTGVANDVETWRAALRVLKPGGHLLAFSGTRTYHRMVCAIEDAGFEIRDQIGWLYGSGFPKSLDVSKAIDKRRDDSADEERRRVILAVTGWIAAARDASGVSNRDIDAAFGHNGMAGHWTSSASQPSVPTAEQWPPLLALLGADEPPEDVRDAVDAWLKIKGQPAPTWSLRAITGQHEKAAAGQSWNMNVLGRGDLTPKERRDIPATDAARQWQGWGTALKPAWEPIVLARKPLGGTVAANVLQHGTGALNIDGCRVATDENLNGGAYAESGGREVSGSMNPSGMNVAGKTVGRDFVQPLGRWPANIIHDGSDEVLAAFPQAPGAFAPVTGKEPTGHGFSGNVYGAPGTQGRQASDRRDGGGSAARFFYTAKASGGDRNDGGQRVSGADRNTHPTVKPTDLMRYLCRLVTPPGGTVLDPFMGSGSTLKAAELEGYSAIGIELDPAYIEIARRRIASDAPLFAEVAA